MQGLIRRIPVVAFFIILASLGELAAVVMFFNTNTTPMFAIIFIIFPLFLAVIHQNYKSRISSIRWYVYPTFWIALSIFMIFFLAPVMTLFGTSATLPFQDWNWQYKYGSTLMLGSIALFAMLLGNLKPDFSKQENFLFRKIESSKVNFLFVILSLTYGIFGFLIWVNSQGGLPTILFSRSKFQIQGFTFNNGYLYDSLLVITGVLTALLARKRTAIDSRPGIIEFGILLTMIPYIARGDRSVFLYTLIVVLIIYSMTSKNRKYKMRYILLIFLLIPLLVVAPRIYRHAESFQISDMAKGYSIQAISQTITGLDTAMVPALAILRSQLGNSIEYQYGKSYFSGILKPIPRILWTNKPIEIDRQLNNELFPNTSKQVGFSFSGLSEPLVNFGVPGIIIFFFLLGKIENMLFKFGESITVQRIILIAWYSGFMFVLIRGNLSTDLQRFLFPTIPALLSIKRINRMAINHV